MSSTNGDSPLPAPRGESPTGSPRGSLSTSLQAAATLNAGLQHESPRRSSSASHSRNPGSPTAGRRRSAVLHNLHHNDPSLPGPGEMLVEGQQTNSANIPQATSPIPMSGSPHLIPGGDPHHNRTPSLGELHQELEAEQESQVNRLLQTIREQQAQLHHLQGGQAHNSSATIDDSTAVSETSNHGTPAPQSGSGSSSMFQPPPPPPPSGSFSRSPVAAHHPRSSFDIARADLHRRSRTPSRGASPRLRSTSISGESDQTGLGRDESALYQAETQMLVRENQMLRHRIRDLERQLSEAFTGSPQANPSEPTQPSHLIRATSIEEENGSTPSISEMAPPLTGAFKPTD